MTSQPDTLLIDGNDIRDPAAFPGFKVVGDLNLLAPGTRRGQDQVIPGRPGQVGAPGLKVDAYAFSVFVYLNGSNREEYFVNLRAASAILHGTASDGLVTMHRRLSHPDPPGYTEYYAQGRFVSGLSFATLNPNNGKSELQFVNLDGGWRRVSDNVLVIP